MKLYKLEASWCGPCKQMTTIMRGLDYTPVDIEEEGGREMARGYKVTSIPTLVLQFDNGEWDSLTGLQPRKRIDEWLAKNGWFGDIH